MPERPAVTVLALVVLLAVAPASSAVSGGAAMGTQTETSTTEISSCTTITESGEYVLTGDVTNESPTRPRNGLGACIAVRADDVTLRGRNHTVAAGPGGAPGVVGVLVSPRTRARGVTLSGVRVGGRQSRSNVTVQNLTTTRWGAGVAVLGATGVTLRNVSAANNLGDGIFAENATDLRLRGGSVRGSNTGVFLRRSPDASVANLTVADNLAGVSVRRSDDATLRNLSVSRHSQYGVALVRSANATLENATLRDDGFAEIALARSSDARLVGVSVADSPGWEVYAVRDSAAVGERVRLGATTLSFEVRDAALDAATETPPLPLTDRQVVGDSLFVRPTAADARLSLSLGYADSAVERARTTEDTLSLWRFDAGSGWARAETTVDAERNRASADFENLSENGTVVALVGEGLAESENATDRS
ncbi:right-handed parallel beta-helix repeat-containing protein [Halorussus limi]|uniref:Right-handed parallel beta-helix repeat-containing protein n=1 Tax=Halorussus limi TaxID=2938695 RepID=A0A8U0HX32_9EURY|nr:right-handed parallel beta-helix repeat-containing protein [Halorussus limi]UPV75468.1 right-handed parallel beta-helix repeat-containing protein [Halorussus limi]